jgi:hypothetical protein
MERGLKSIFAACGIDLVGRNHAMGGTKSAPEIAICSKEIFGNDIDLLHWDTGMTDGRNPWKMLMYFLRAGINAQQPAVLGYNMNMLHGVWPTAVQAAEDTGMPAFVLDHTEEGKIHKAIPNTFGLSEEEIAEMPPFVRSFKCGTQEEKGDPGCAANKFNQTMCYPGRPFMTSWHGGW